MSDQENDQREISFAEVITRAHDALNRDNLAGFMLVTVEEADGDKIGHNIIKGFPGEEDRDMFPNITTFGSATMRYLVGEEMVDQGIRLKGTALNRAIGSLKDHLVDAGMNRTEVAACMVLVDKEIIIPHMKKLAKELDGGPDALLEKLFGAIGGNDDEA